MTRFQYLGYLLFKPRDSSERFVQVLMWAIMLMVGGSMLWESWNQYVVRGEAFTWDKDWKHWVERGGWALVIICGLLPDPEEKGRVRTWLMMAGLATVTIVSSSWTILAIWISLTAVWWIVISIWPGIISKPKQPDQPPPSGPSA